MMRPGWHSAFLTALPSLPAYVYFPDFHTTLAESFKSRSFSETTVEPAERAFSKVMLWWPPDDPDSWPPLCQETDPHVLSRDTYSSRDLTPSASVLEICRQPHVLGGLGSGTGRALMPFCCRVLTPVTVESLT